MAAPVARADPGTSHPGPGVRYSCLPFLAQRRVARQPLLLSARLPPCSFSPPRPALQLLTPESLILLRPAPLTHPPPPNPRQRQPSRALPRSRQYIPHRVLPPDSFAATHGIVNPRVCCWPPILRQTCPSRPRPRPKHLAHTDARHGRLQALEPLRQRPPTVE